MHTPAWPRGLEDIPPYIDRQHIICQTRSHPLMFPVMEYFIAPPLECYLICINKHEQRLDIEACNSISELCLVAIVLSGTKPGLVPTTETSAGLLPCTGMGI